MKLQTFTGTTYSECLAKVRSEFGGDALIFNTRTIERRYLLGLRRREIVEITAGCGQKAPRRPLAALGGAKAPGAVARSAPQPKATHCPAPGVGLLATPAVASVIVTDLLKRLDGLAGAVQKLDTKFLHQQAPSVPDEVLEYYSLMTGAGICPGLACDLVKTVHRALRQEHLGNAEFVKEKLAEQIEKMLVSTGPITRTKGAGPHVVALVGATGVGKTTTIAKLAANLMLRDGRRVGLITNDTYRIAAVEQLKRYADIIGAPLAVVSGPDELGPALRNMRDFEYVLVDTAGRSPSDTLKIGELRNLLGAAGPDEVHLVLSATSSEGCIEQAISRFGAAPIDKLIFTKLDETAQLGILVNVASRVRKPLSYVTTGQDVPDDIEVARGKRLARLILGSES
jgi:flagellar biosynthesis protein FlhF